MYVEVIRLVADALVSDDYGVNAKLATIPKETTEDSPPAVLAVKDSTRDPAVALGRIGPDFPVLIVSQEGPGLGRVASRLPMRQADVTVAIRYATGDADTEQAYTDASRTIWAVVLTLVEWLRPANAADRLHNYVEVVSLAGEDSLQFGEILEQAEDGVIVGAVTAAFTAKDRLATR